MGVRNEVHASMEVYVKHTSVTHSTIQLMTYFGWSRAHFGQLVGGEDSAEVEVVAAAAAAVVEPGAVGGPAVVVAAAAELPAVAAEISVAAAAG